jgi:hypothetical protein
VRHLFIVLAIAVVAACGTSPSPAPGPTLPSGAHMLTLKQLSLLGPNDVGNDVIASTSLAQVREAVIAHAHLAQYCTTNAGVADRCWGNLADEPGHVYIAVVINPQCTSPTQEMTAIGGSTLYFIQWIGKPQRVCDLALMLPQWRLYSAMRSDLPKSGTLTVRLEFQGSDSSAMEVQVPLT